MQNRSTKRFLSMALGNPSPKSAHPGYDKNDARVTVLGENLTLHFLKEEDGQFVITLYADCDHKGDAPAVELGSVSAEVVRNAEKSKVLVYEGREFKLSDTRTLRKIL